MKNEKQLTFRDLRPDAAAAQEALQYNRHPLSLLIDGATDPRNLGGIFRLADAALVGHIYFYRSSVPEISPKVKRISRHTTDLTPYSFLTDLSQVKDLQTSHKLLALEYTDRSIPYTDFQLREQVLLIIGNEQKGVSQELLDLAEQSIHLPMYGLKTSMNVMCAAAVAVYGLLASQD